jgi:phosphoribosylglycinamide formyltransferase-1
MKSPTVVGVLVSGSGTNLQALLDAGRASRLGGATIRLVVSNKSGVRALERAAAAGVAAEVVDHKAFADRAAFEAALVERLRAAGVELVVLAGFMRILGATFLDAFPGRVVNVHPALLPAFPGVDGQGQALAAGARLAGCTVHFVDAGVDSGPIVAQAAVPVLDGDTAETLSARILAEEHRLLPAVVRWIAEGRVIVEGRRVRVAGLRVDDGALRSPPIDED